MIQMDTELLSDTFVDLADTMVADFDVIDFLHLLTDRSVALLAASAAGVVLADPRGELRLAAASTEAGRAARSCSSCRTTRGPAWNASAPARPCHRRRPGRPGPAMAPVRRSRRAGRVPDRWRRCRCGCGIRSSGALNLFRCRAGPGSTAADLRIGQAWPTWPPSGCCTSGTCAAARPSPSSSRAALNSRVVIEQAKGKLAERLSIDMDHAFKMLRDYARNSNQHLTDVARDFVDGATADFPPAGPASAAR
jgi:hypothetical protein